MQFKDSALAHKYLDNLTGVEIGAAFHNPFNLNTINVDRKDIYGNYIDEQKRIGGDVVKVDVFADACYLPFKNKEYDFVISSHVLDRIWRPDLAIQEWCRVAGKYIFIILPIRKNSSYTQVKDIISRPALKNYPDKQHNIWDLKSFLDMISTINEVDVVESLPVDDKVGNGFCVVLKIKDVPVVQKTYNDIVGFWHICMINHYAEIIKEQLDLLINSGLYESVKNIYVSCVGSEEELNRVKSLFLNYSKIIVASHKIDIKEYEFPSLDIIKQKSNELDPFVCFYIHTKGVSYDSNHEGGIYWRDYMNYYTISQWKENIEKLELGYDTCGVKLIPKGSFQMHYSGNFWWSKSEYLKNLKSTDSLNKNDRFEAEMWLCKNNPKAASLCQDFVDYNTKGKFMPQKNRIVVHTLAYNLTSEVRDAVDLLYKQNNSGYFTHVIVDLGFPIIEKNDIPLNIDAAKLINARENIDTAIKYGSKFMHIQNQGVSQNWEAVRNKFNISDDDVLICADPDERPKNDGWVKAISDVINAEKKIAWCSLMMREHQSLLRNTEERRIAGHRVYVMNSGFNWAQGGFNGKFLNQIGGVPVPKGAPIYGWIEQACTEKMQKLGYKIAILADYFVEHTECSPLYRAWKTDITSNVKDGQIDFETWLRKKKVKMS